jgi:hypothetical protein
MAFQWQLHFPKRNQKPKHTSPTKSQTQTKQRKKCDEERERNKKGVRHLKKFKVKKI